MIKFSIFVLTLWIITLLCNNTLAQEWPLVSITRWLRIHKTQWSSQTNVEKSYDSLLGHKLTKLVLHIFCLFVCLFLFCICIKKFRVFMNYKVTADLRVKEEKIQLTCFSKKKMRMPKIYFWHNVFFLIDIMFLSLVLMCQ